jgi:SHS2 domain-containing protein
MQAFKFLSDAKEIKFQAFGDSLEDCFANAGLALTKIVCKDKIRPCKKRIIKVKGREKEGLLYDFLEEFLYLIEVGGFLVSEVKNIKITGESRIRNKIKRYNMVLSAEVWGDDLENYNIDTDIKTITRKGMFIKEEEKNNNKIFVCQVVVD